MDEVLKKIDELDIVKLLRLFAIVVFLVEFIAIPLGYFKGFLSIVNGWEYAVATLWGVLISIVQALYKPAILLGIAEIIKIMKEKK